MGKVYIFGHRNPDTDSVCGAISLSYLKNMLGVNSEPRILGEISDETKYALKRFNIKTPSLLEDVKVRIKDIRYHMDYFVEENSSIYKTYNYMNEHNITGVPIVDSEKKYVGYVSLKEIAKTMINDHNNYLNTTFLNIVETLGSKNFYKATDDITGNVISATFEDSTFIENVKLDNNSILIVGDRKKIIDYAISSKVLLIILIGDISLSEEDLINIKKNNINLIYTPYKSFQVCKLLELSNNINTIKRNEKSICLSNEDFLTDFIEIANRTKHTNYPIVNNKGICYGMLRLIDTNEYSRKKVILVDHNSFKQSVDGLEEAEIEEIIDHHNIADTTKIAINYRIMPVGSVNTIIYYMYKESNVEIPKDIMGLMLSGILSDTLILNSPTTTYQDTFVVNELSKELNLDYKEYGLSLLKSGINFDNKSLEDIIYSDYKTYSVKDKKFSIGQVLAVDFEEFNNKKDLYIEKLNEISNKNGYRLTALFITNILDKKSMILYSNNSEYILKDAYNLEEIHEGIIIEELLSRKKQIVPNLMEVFERL